MSTTTKRGRGRPPLADDVERVSLSLPVHLLRLVQDAAKRERCSVAEWLRRAALVRLSSPGVRE